MEGGKEGKVLTDPPTSSSPPHPQHTCPTLARTHHPALLPTPTPPCTDPPSYPPHPPRCIPKNVPGADWRVLEEIVRKDPSREKFNGQPLVPWCLPNTADRHNGWRGLFGRLDLQGHFPTSTTDPQPMGKVCERGSLSLRARSPVRARVGWPRARAGG